ncbi:hypothetical protein NCC78_29950 [Micromonospora phytophila]|uniref:hypothetical protein n=1 Tax=Micromonospora phytophila TaxID=709888 RepID=UPI00202F16E7|nr:hypothetical protein [Micromonospora phytophila]MCM0678863.1 hypothetical protein [Micromonospora phytophila]
MIRSLVTATTALATLAGAAVLVGTRSWRSALRVLLDLLTAAGLLRLAVGQGWADLVAAAAIILLRRLLWAALTAGSPSVRLSAASSGQEDHDLPLAVGRETGESGRTAT